MRQKVQLKLIEEVNNTNTNNRKRDSYDNDCDRQLVPREGNIGLRSSLIDYNGSNSSGESNMVYATKKTRAQMVPRTETLAPVFKTL